MTLDISVVTPVCDDPELIHALRSVPVNVEYIVVLTCAPERVKKIAKDFRREHRPDMIVREVDIVGMSAGVNFGVELANCEKIAVLDSDCTLTIDTLRAYSRALESTDFVRGVTKVHRKDFWSSFSGLGQEELNRVFSKKARLIGPSIAFRKKTFLKLGGYDLEIGGSCDHEFVLRVEDAGYVTAFEPEAIVWHTAITLKIDVRSHLGYGKSMRSIDIKRGGLYGLGICLDRWAPGTIWRKLTQRGPASLLRTLLLGKVMIVGYIHRSYQYWKTNR
jgi:GT2 family glycosyltransferase